jgi:hypothetical protein
MKKFTPLAMKCSQKDWDSIKGRLEGMYKESNIDSFNRYPYLTNAFRGSECIANIDVDANDWNRTVHETFNAKIFLEACGIETYVYEITKEQVLELAQHTHLAKDWFPDAFKKELEICKWYNWKKGKALFNFQENGNIYGFLNGKWHITDHWTWDDFENCQEATPQEIESALICEAKKRGYKDGNYKCMSTVGRTHKHNFDYIYDFYDNIVFTGWNENDQRNIIFKDGQWAKIIETITIQEAEKLLNKKIV